MRVRQQAHEGGPWLDAGSTLVEILVSIIVMAIGILGLVGLQIFMVRHLREARLQTTAMTLATELAERMRGNPSVAARRDPSSNPYLRPRLRAAPTEVAIDCAVARCETPEQLATWDVVEWAGRLFSVESGLPDARVTICFDEQTFDADESERLLRGVLSGALFEAGLYCRADDRGDPVVQLAPPLVCTQEHFDEMEQILRVVLDKAWSLL